VRFPESASIECKTRERNRKGARTKEIERARRGAHNIVDMGSERLEIRLLLRERELRAESDEALAASRDSNGE
jgi:hypothetical protein